MTISYAHVLQAFYGDIWAIRESKLLAMDEVLRDRIQGIHVTPEGIAAIKQDAPQAEHFEISAAQRRKFPKTAGKIAVLPMFGVMAQRMNMMQQASGGTSTEQFGAMLDAARLDDSVGAAVIRGDTPGGSVFGMFELADKIRAFAETKPIYAIADSLAASAGYLQLASVPKGNFAVTPGGQIGDIGVISQHYDYSEANAASGVKPTIIRAGKFKGEGHPDIPLEDDVLANIQERVDTYYDQFVDAVAAGREVRTTVVKQGFGQGTVMLAKAAVAEGMADKVSTFEKMISELTGAAPTQRRGFRAEDYRLRSKVTRATSGRIPIDTLASNDKTTV